MVPVSSNEEQNELPAIFDMLLHIAEVALTLSVSNPWPVQWNLWRLDAGTLYRMRCWKLCSWFDQWPLCERLWSSGEAVSQDMAGRKEKEKASSCKDNKNSSHGQSPGCSTRIRCSRRNDSHSTSCVHPHSFRNWLADNSGGSGWNWVSFRSTLQSWVRVRQWL